MKEKADELRLQRELKEIERKMLEKERKEREILVV